MEEVQGSDLFTLKHLIRKSNQHQVEIPNLFPHGTLDRSAGSHHIAFDLVQLSEVSN